MTSNRSSAASRLPLPLLLLFVGSGCSALIYEIVWFQLLQLVIGSSSVSLGILLGTFMGGMCLGSYVLPRFVGPRRNPLVVYAVMELLIGVFGVALFYWLPVAGRMYTANVAPGAASVTARAIICLLSLLPPAMLMGATLPAIARWMKGSRQGISRLSFFYVANLFGAVLGCVTAGFFLLRLTNLETSTYVAAVINLIIAAVALLVSRRIVYTPEVPPEEDSAEQHGRSRQLVYWTIAISGLTALSCEVIWTRILSLLLGATVYTFSIILAVFLVGLGIGSSVGSYLARETRSPRFALAICQGLLTIAIVWSAYSLCRTIPYWPFDPNVYTTPLNQYQLDVARCLWCMLPATCLWGASFPLALASASRRNEDTGKLVGGIYAANTVGAIIGALAASLLLIGAIGTRSSQHLMISLAGVSAMLAFFSYALAAPDKDDADDADDDEKVLQQWHRRRTAGYYVLALAPLILLCCVVVPDVPPELIAGGRRINDWRNDLPGLTKEQLVDYIHVEEGANASIAVSEHDDGTRNFHVSGKVVASSEPKDMRLQRMLGHIPAMLHSKPKTVLVVGCGAGVTAGSFLVHPDIERVVICEIEPRVPRAAGKYFANQNHDVMNDPRTEVIYDDARHFIATTDEKFDIITSDPIHPWVRGAAALYSKDYYELCQQRLKPGGIITQWVPLYETSEEAAKSAVATFFAAFPQATVWGNDDQGRGYDIVMLGQKAKLKIDAEELDDRLQSADHEAVQESLAEVDMGTAFTFLATYAGKAPDMKSWLNDAQINRDRNLRLQYLAGMSLNLDEAGLIYHRMLLSREYPDDIITAPAAWAEDLREEFRRQLTEE